MTKVGMARKSAANICSRFSGTVRGIAAIRLTVLSLCAAGAVLAYEVMLGDLTGLLQHLPSSLKPAMVLEAFLWLLVYLAFWARYSSLSRLCAIGREKKRRILPMVLSLIPVILFILPLRLLAVGLSSRRSTEILLGLLNRGRALWNGMATRIALLATGACIVLLLVLVCMAVHVALTRMIINRHVLGRLHPIMSIRQGFRYCLAPVSNFLRHLFWLMASAVLMVEFAYLTWMQYEVSLVYIALGALLLGGYWLAGFGPGFWGEYHVTFLCLIRRLSDDEYADLNA